MENTPVFNIGSPPRIKRFKGESYKSAKRRHDRAKRLEVAQKKLQGKPRAKEQLWFLLPKDCVPNDHIYFGALMTRGNSYINRVLSLREYRFVRPEERDMMLALLQQNALIRYRLRKFCHKWRLTHMKNVNEDDPITLAPIEKPVYIYSYSNRRRYVYEAETLAKDIHKKLLHTDIEIPCPLAARNPLTNEVLTLAQLISVYKQCRAYGKTHWTMESYAKCSFDMPTFEIFERKHLRTHAIQSVFQNPRGYDAKDMLEGFIEAQFGRHGKRFIFAFYHWAIAHKSETHHINMWRKLCKEWYMVEIIADDISEMRYKYNDIQDKTKELCKMPKPLYKEFMEHIEIRPAPPPSPDYTVAQPFEIVNPLRLEDISAIAAEESASPHESISH